MRYTYAHNFEDVTELEREGRFVARKLAQEAIVLLENDGALPLETQRIALFGTGASKTIAGGTGSGEVNVRHAVSVREGLEAAGFNIVTSGRLDAYEQTWFRAREAFVEEQRAKLRVPTPRAIGELIGAEFQHPADIPVTEEEALALNVDTCVYVLSRQSGEGLDRVDEAGSFRLSDQELDDIRVCADSFAKTIVVLNVGAPVDVSWRHEIEGVNALVHMGQLGQEGGHALADILSGAVSPSGRLAVTWPESISQVPYSGEFGRASANPDEADYSEGIYVGYRYYTSFDVRPAYTFGHGLSYTQFEDRFVSACLEDGVIRVSVEVENTGEVYAGKRAIALYASCPDGELEKESMRLVAFAKTEVLFPHESSEVSLSFALRDLASYDDRSAQTVVEAGDYRVFVSDTPQKDAADFTLRVLKRLVLEQHRNACGAVRPVAKMRKAQDGKQPEAGATIIEVGDVETAVHEYGRSDQAPSELRDLVDALSTSQLIALCVGTGLGDEGEGLCVPGAVGHTTSALLGEGLANHEMCDGPAGLRVQRRSAKTKSGNIKPIDPPLSIYEYLPSLITKRMFGDPSRDEVVYQYVTGFPASSSVAQSWNIGLANMMGQTVGREMAEYQVKYWLAPALNIVRNPLCGRNFEYYSEDPIMSGKMAAAVTRGVQASPGRYACLKHFAANNQETNRTTSSSNVDERVLREVYLRGFEIAVREGRPASVMASYNKVNGVYATESADLLTTVLRDEWRFDGIVMTDWFATGFGHADECKAIAAGTDLIMPGGRLARLALALGVRSGRLSLASLKTACCRVLAKSLG